MLKFLSKLTVVSNHKYIAKIMASKIYLIFQNFKNIKIKNYLNFRFRLLKDTLYF